jgi:hypothetical protein
VIRDAVLRFVAACSASEDATSQALFRILVGACVLFALLDALQAGVVDVLFVDVAYGGMRSLGHPPWLIALLGGATPGVIHALIGVGVVGGLALVLGVGGRLTALLTLFAVGNVVDVNGHAGGSYDELLSNALWLVVLSGGHRTLSLQARLTTGSWWPAVQVLAFPRWLALWQLCLMYGTTGLQKVSTYWVPGGDFSALYYIMQQPTWQRSDMTWVADAFVVTQAATAVTWFWEVFAFFWILFVWWSATPERPGRLRAWSNRLQLRWVFAAIGLVMHLIIFVTMEVGPFSPLSASFYVLIAHPWEWRRWLDRSPATQATEHAR